MSSPTRIILGSLPVTPKGTRHRVADTPRKRKNPPSDRLMGIKSLKETLSDIKTRTRQRLKLGFDLEDWQGELIRRLRMGYDSIMIAGTGYGKSVVFEGLAALNKTKIVIVICPLKALERDQVNEARKKELIAIMVNEDTVSPEIWAGLRQGRANLYYVSPEMALSNSFIHLWQDRGFRNRVQAVVVDEAHCIVEWGEDFRKEYGGLAKLRDYIGQETPILATTATCDSEAFDTIWKSLKFGCRPFWGIDVGTDRTNLLYITRVVKNTANPLLDIVNIFPEKMDKDTQPTALPKCLFYFNAIDDCALAVETLRKCFPSQLRPLVQTFKSTLSEPAKQVVWDRFKSGEIRVLCATDAAGMGCNVADVEYTVLTSLPDSLSPLSQRWGRTGRSRSILGTCILLVPKWVFRPEAVDLSIPQKKRETKADADRRAKLDKSIENFANADCFHQYLRTHFRPATGLDTYHSLDSSEVPNEAGWRSKAAQRALSWIVLDLKRTPPSGRCCSRCTPDFLSRYPPSDRHDTRLKMFASDFLFPIPSFSRRQRMDSISSTNSTSTTMTSHSPSRPAFVPFTHKVQVPKDQLDNLVAALDKWRTEKQARRSGGRSLFSKRVFLPEAQLKKIADHAGEFLRATAVTADLVFKFAPLDLASADDLKEIASIISDWRPDAQLAIGLTPRGGHRQKQQNTATFSHDADETPSHSMPIPQPHFSPARLARGRGRGRARGRGAAGSAATAHLQQPHSPMIGAANVSTPTVTPFPPIYYPSSTPTSVQQQSYVPPTPYTPSYSPQLAAYHAQMYSLQFLPPRYYPPTPNDENRNT